MLPTTSYGVLCFVVFSIEGSKREVEVHSSHNQNHDNYSFFYSVDYFRLNGHMGNVYCDSNKFYNNTGVSISSIHGTQSSVSIDRNSIFSDNFSN